MPHRVYAHDCCPDAPYRKPGRPDCPHCGTPGTPAGWGLSVVEHWGHFQRAWGLSVMGPHCRLARELLGPFRRGCAECGGSGYVGWEHRRRCAACDGGGGVWVGDEEELRAAYRAVIDAYPKAGCRGALYQFHPGEDR